MFPFPTLVLILLGATGRCGGEVSSTFGTLNGYDNGGDEAVCWLRTVPQPQAIGSNQSTRMADANINIIPVCPPEASLLLELVNNEEVRIRYLLIVS